MSSSIRNPARRTTRVCAACLLIGISILGSAARAQAVNEPGFPQAAAVRIRTYLNQSSVAPRPPADDGGANAMLGAAEDAMAAGRPAEAEAGFRRALALLEPLASTPPDQPAAIDSMISFLLVNQGRMTEAEALARPIEASGLAPAHAARQRASFVLSVVAAMNGRYDEAAQRLKALVDLALAGDDPETAGQLSVMLAAMYRTLGRNQDATDAIAVSTLPPGPISDLARLRQAVDGGDNDAALAAADRLIALPPGTAFPESLRAYAIAERGKVLMRRARTWTGAGLAPDLVEAERSLRAALASGLSNQTPLMNILLQDALGLTLLADASAHPRSARTLEGLALLKTVADRREQLLGLDNPAAVGTRIDYAVWLSVAGQDAQALKIMDAMAARADVAPGLMTRERRGMLDVSRASVMMRDLRLGDAYLTLQAAGQSLQAYALAPERRDDARAGLASHSVVFRTQVLLGFLAAREMTARAIGKR